MSESEFSTDQVFTSSQELVEWAKKLARSQGYVLVTKRSAKTNGYLSKIVLMCDLGGVYRSSGGGARKTATRKVDCKFELVGRYYKTNDLWVLSPQCLKHNHEPALYMEGHPYARRLSNHETNLVATMTDQNLKARDILSTLKVLDENNVSTSRTIYNAQQKIRLIGNEGQTPIQVVFSFLQKKKYHFQYRTNDSTNKLEELFFVHPISIKIWLAFPDILLMDATYKTNKFDMPLLEIVGVTSTSKTFLIACVLLDKERKSNFLWALNCLKMCISTYYTPRVIITDRDLGLMNACEEIFPKANKLLCRWHISENILKHCRQSFKLQEEYDSFKYSWDKFVKAPTKEKCEKHYSDLQEKLISHQRVLNYLHNTWLNKYRDKFMSILTDRYLSFGNSTTNRVEGQHSKVKLYLGTSQARLDTLICFIDKVVLSQHTSIKESIEVSRIFRQHDINNPQFQELWGLVSQTALGKIFKELNRPDGFGLTSKNCGCQLRSSHGLPCAHELMGYFNENDPIPLHSIDAFWRKLDLEPSIVVEDVDDDFDSERKDVKTTLIGEPEYHKDNRGRPSLKKSKQSTKKPKPTTSSARSESFDLKKEPEYQDPFMTDTNQPSDAERNFLIKQGLEMFLPYITRIQDVGKDGNCGFRAVASCLGRHEDFWRDIRMDLLNELADHEATYDLIFNKKGVQDLQNMLYHFEGGHAPEERWMVMPDTGLLVASKYNVVVVFLSKEGETLCLPLFSSPPKSQPHHIFVIERFNKNHFVRLELQGDFPIPPTHPQWSFHAFDQTWEHPYIHRQNMFNQLKFPNRYL